MKDSGTVSGGHRRPAATAGQGWPFTRGAEQATHPKPRQKMGRGKAYTVREYSRGGRSQTSHMFIDEDGLKLVSQDNPDSPEDVLPFATMSSYDTGGSFGSESTTDNNSMVIIMRPTSFGEPFVRREEPSARLSFC